MPKKLPDVLAPDVDEFCYILAQAIIRLLEEEDSANRKNKKHSQDSRDNAIKATPIQSRSLMQTQEESIDQ